MFLSSDIFKQHKEAPGNTQTPGLQSVSNALLLLFYHFQTCLSNNSSQRKEATYLEALGLSLYEDEEMEQTALMVISMVGYPIEITFYLLTNFQKSIDRLSKNDREFVELTEFLQAI
jgi:hypothetical protein